MHNNLDFTLERYKIILNKLKGSYKFINYQNVMQLSTPSILWRHDVDVSVHNAEKISKIENEAGVKATYFFMLGNWFYDIRDFEIHDLIKNIISDGHHIGLHYDFEYLPTGKVTCIETFLESLEHQQRELAAILNCEILTFSFHNPTTVDSILFEEMNANSTILGMTNAYCDQISKQFKYCSDSNGQWRFEKLEDLIDNEKYPYLHVLTHPDWWSAEPMSPRNKIKHALDQRSKAILKRYDELLSRGNRPNF